MQKCNIHLSVNIVLGKYNFDCTPTYYVIVSIITIGIAATKLPSPIAYSVHSPAECRSVKSTMEFPDLIIAPLDYWFPSKIPSNEQYISQEFTVGGIAYICFKWFQITADAQPGLSWVSNDQKFCEKFKNTHCQVDHPAKIE